MKNSNLFLRLMSTLLLVMFLTVSPAIVSAKMDSQPQYGGVLKIIEFAEGGQPIGTPWYVRGNDIKLIKPAIESLIRVDVKGNYHPGLAKEWIVDKSNNTITLPIRKGIKFHDGTDFNAEAAKWCIDRAIEAKQAKGFLSVDVLDGYTIRISLEEYHNSDLYTLSGSVAGMISPTAYKEKGEEWAKWHPVGTGPFKFVSFERGNKLKYDRWEGYWQEGKPYLDSIEYLFIRDPMTQQAAMRASGDERVHVLAVTAGEQAAMMKAQGFEVISVLVGTCTLIPDSKNIGSPLSNKKVREAISHAIDREAIVKARGFGYWAPADQNPPPGMPGYVEGLTIGRYDPETAKRLLAEAGYPNGFKIKLIVMPGVVDRDAMVSVQRFLNEVGIQVELEYPDRGLYSAYRWRNGWNDGFLAQNTRTLATINIGYNFYWQEVTGQFPSLKRTPGLVDTLDASLATLNAEEARMQEMTRMIAEDVMVIYLYYYPEIFILQSSVHDSGYGEWSASTVFTPENAWLSK